MEKVKIEENYWYTMLGIKAELNVLSDKTIYNLLKKNILEKKTFFGKMFFRPLIYYNKKLKYRIDMPTELLEIKQNNISANKNQLIKLFYENNKSFNKSKAAILLRCSRQHIYKILEKIK